MRANIDARAGNQPVMMRDLARTVAREALAHRQVPAYEPEGRRVWLIRPDHLGDVLFLRPGLKRFRE